jgi:hypothetical protein
MLYGAPMNAACRAVWMAGMGMILGGEIALAEPAIWVGPTYGAPGTTVSVPINITVDTNVTSLQFDLLYNGNYLTNGAATAGPAIGSDLFQSAPEGQGDCRVIVASLSNTPITNGVLVNIPFTIFTNAPDSDQTLSFSNVIMVTPQLDEPPSTQTNGILSIIVPPQFTAVTPTNAGAIHLELSGTAGRTYVIQAATNLMQPVWLPLTTNIATTNLVEFNDPGAATLPQRFYRASAAP